MQKVLVFQELSKSRSSFMIFFLEKMEGHVCTSTGNLWAPVKVGKILKNKS